MIVIVKDQGKEELKIEFYYLQLNIFLIIKYLFLFNSYF
jgi:hypothetical protein